MRAKPRQNPGNEPGRRGAVLLVAANACELVHRAERQPAAWQGIVDCRNAERQHIVSRRAFDPADALAKRLKAAAVDRTGHAPRTPSLINVSFLFC
jgi:hypothetical protein